MSTNLTGVQQARDRVLQMARQIEDLAQSNSPPEVFFPEFLRLLVGSMGARAGAVWMLNGGPRLTLAHELRFADTGIADNPGAASLNERLLSETVTTGQAACFAPDDPSMTGKMPANFLIILAALQIDEDGLGVVELFQRPDAPREARPGFLQFVEQMVGHASRYLERRNAQTDSSDSATFMAEFEQFLLQLQRGNDVSEVAVTVANDGRQLLGCDRLSVAIRSGAQTSIVATSGQDRVNPRANLTRAMATIAERIIELGEPLTFAGKIEQLPPQIEEPLAAFIQESGSRMVKLLPLVQPQPLIMPDESDRRESTAVAVRDVVGCLIIEQTADSRPRPRLEARAEMLADHAGAVLWHAKKRDQILGLKLWQALGKTRDWFRGRKLAKTSAVLGAAVLFVGSLCLIPWEYRVTGKGKLMPVLRQQVYAPENGNVAELRVHGGEHVHKGDVLLILHNEQLLAELNENKSKLLQSQQARSSSLAQEQEASHQGDKKGFLTASAARAKADTEVEALTELVKLLRQRVDSLSIVSPIEGTVATFQLDQLLQNRPVQQGELLLDVMDEAGPWRLELEVDGNRVGHVLRAWNDRPDHRLDVEFIPATDPEATFYGRVENIASRLNVSSEQSNALEVDASTDTTKIRNRWIGAEVRAKISCGKRSLGYVLFGDVIEFIRQRLWL